MILREYTIISHTEGGFDLVIENIFYYQLIPVYHFEVTIYIYIYPLTFKINKFSILLIILRVYIFVNTYILIKLIIYK